MVRTVSAIAHVRGDAARLGEIDPMRRLGELQGHDPASFARWAKQYGREMDGALGTNFQELAERTAAGEDPIERIDPAHTLKYQYEKRVGEASAGGEQPATRTE